MRILLKILYVLLWPQALIARLVVRSGWREK